MRYTRISADCHIDMPWMPNDLFTVERVGGAEGPDALRGRRAGRTVLDLQERHVVRPGVRRGPSRREATSPGRTTASTRWRETGLYDDAKQGMRRVIDPHLRVKDAGARRRRRRGDLRHPRRGHAPERPRGRARRCSASTTTGSWISASRYPDRLIGLACLPYGDIDAAVKEIHRAAKMGLRGLELSCSWDMEPM